MVQSAATPSPCSYLPDMPCSKSIEITADPVPPAPYLHYFAQNFLATGTGVTTDGYRTISGSEAGSFIVDIPAYLSATQVRITLYQRVQTPLRLENLGTSGGNHRIPSTDPSWPHNPCWAGTYAWQWGASLSSSLGWPDLSSALSYSETDLYQNVVTDFDGQKDWRGASGRSFQNWFQFGVGARQCPIQLDCSVINSKIPSYNQIISCDGVTIDRVTNYMVRNLSTGYNGTPAPNIPPVTSSVGGNVLPLFPSGGTVSLPWSLAWDFTGPTNPGFETHASALMNLQVLFEFWYMAT